jgi:biotin carboxylase
MGRHLVFVDGNGQIFNAIESSLDVGDHVTWLHATDFKFYSLDERARSILERVERIVEVAAITDRALVEGALERVRSERPIDVIVTLVDFAVAPTAQAAARLGIRFANLSGVERALDKVRMREALRSAGLPTARSARVNNAAEALAVAAEMDYPVILKPVSGLASIAAATITTPDELLQAWDEADRRLSALPNGIRGHMGAGLVIEQRLRGQMVSVELAVRDGHYHVFMISGRHRNEFSETDALGISMPADLEPADWTAAVRHAVEVVEAVGLDFGIFHIEMMMTPDGPRVVELNPRLMGGSMPMLYKLLTGHDIFHSLYDLHSGAGLSVPDPHGFGCVVSLRLRVAAPCVMATAPEHDWLSADDCPELLGLTLDLPASFPASLDSSQLLGRFQIRRDTAPEAALAFIGWMERALGVRLIRPADEFAADRAIRSSAA